MQKAAVLRSLKQPYLVDHDCAVPKVLHEWEILVKSHVIGLNPIDWKAPDFGFGIPTLPYTGGRELAGRVIQASKSTSRVKEGDNVICISTDYRDLRKAAYQEYVVSSSFNTVRIPSSVPLQSAATLGVAFVAAALALGICMGVDFSHTADGPDLLELVQKYQQPFSSPGGKGGSYQLPEDIRAECLEGLGPGERALPGDWVAIWGGSSTSANLAVQLARLAGLRVVTLVDTAKHGLRLSAPHHDGGKHAHLRPDLLVDSHDPDRAVAILRASLGPRLRFALDTRGRDSAAALGRALRQEAPGDDVVKGPGLDSAPVTPRQSPRTSKVAPRAHLVGLTGLPKEPAGEDVVYHTVPIKLYHEAPEVGEALSSWLERLLETGALVPPDIIAVEQGFDGINVGLDRMRRGEISGGKAVVVLQ
ncbi:GroES-like protein [Apiospora kogelbergensis]|uniref:GroES-like protein n=1 Tax=Apiospora kogelbergensis TaxID=1337665 RepID=A0AAW0QI94_9PEZI